MIPIGGVNLPDPDEISRELEQRRADPVARLDMLATAIDALFTILARITEDYRGEA